MHLKTFINEYLDGRGQLSLLLAFKLTNSGKVPLQKKKKSQNFPIAGDIRMPMLCPVCNIENKTGCSILPI